MVCADDLDGDRYHCRFVVFFVVSMSCDPWHVEELRGRTKSGRPQGPEPPGGALQTPGMVNGRFTKLGFLK